MLSIKSIPKNYILTFCGPDYPSYLLKVSDFIICSDQINLPPTLHGAQLPANGCILLQCMFQCQSCSFCWLSLI